MAKTATRWTTAQQAAIDTTDRSLLVSAAAGSGKTAVLAERCAQLVCRENDPVNVDEILVVTFTNDAAAEMRGRIELRLRALCGEQPDNARLERQLSLLQRAQISTLHSFCNRIVQQHFQILGLDPSLRLLQDEEAQLMRDGVLQELLHERYRKRHPQAYEKLVQWYANGADAQLAGSVLHLYYLLTSVVNPHQWVNDARKRVRQAIDQFDQSEVAKSLRSILIGGLADSIQSIDTLMQRFRKVDGIEEYVGVLDLLKHEYSMRLKLATAGDLDALAARAAKYVETRLPSIKIDEQTRKSAQKQMEPFRDALKSGTLWSLCRFTRNDWIEGMKSILSPTVQMLTLVRRFTRAYQLAKRQLRAIDFTDQERFALKILQVPRIASEYRRQFKHVLVDEFQDINQVQRDILDQVSRESIATDDVRANLFTVGDVKQSIYRFRLADPGLFLARDRAFRAGSPVGSVIDLQSNFRSRAPLLEAINSVFERLMTGDAMEIEYDASQRLAPGMKYPQGPQGFAGVPIELHLLQKEMKGAEAIESAREQDDLDDLDRTEREAVFVARRIHELTSGETRRTVCEKGNDGKLNTRPVELRDIAILLRATRHKAQQFVEQLLAAGIPAYSNTRSGFFESLEMRDCLSLLRLLNNQQQDIPLAAVLRSPLAHLTDADTAMARIRLAYRDSLAPIAFHEAVRRYANDKQDTLAQQLGSFLGALSRWRELAHRRPLAEVIPQIFAESGYATFCAGLPNGPQRLANLHNLVERARQFGQFQRQSLGRFLDFLDRLEEESDLGQASLLSEQENAVQVMSIHGSKGLEFPVVFVADLGKQFNQNEIKGWFTVHRDHKLGIEAIDPKKQVRYPSAASVVVKEHLRRESLAEELRILYVAMTRAREHLVLVGTCNADESEDWNDHWRGWKGPLPSMNLLEAKSPLDWIGPAAAAIEAAQPGTFMVREWSREALAAMKDAAKHEANEVDAVLQSLRPLKPEPPMTDAVASLYGNLNWQYPFDKYTLIPAAASVTGLTKGGFDEPAPKARDQWNARGTLLDPPRFLITEKHTSAADRGTATHVVLQLLDFRQAATDEQVRRQIDSMVQRRLILPDLAAAVDHDAIVWLMGTELGRILVKHHGSLQREMSLYLPSAVAGGTGLDQVMVRGRLDLLLTIERSMILVDYKTDNVQGAALEQRVAQYTPQLRLYADALEAISGNTVTQKYLVFLTARELRIV